MRTLLWLTCLLAAFAAGSAQAYPAANGLVDVEIVDEYGRPFREFPARHIGGHDESRAYLEAIPGKRYGVRVSNHSATRVGLVIAIDGRNIVSGKKSRLKRNERMYVLGPYESAVYRGWRTGSDRINEFYFTSDLDSYAGAFGDFSAMGVVAVAVYRDRHAPRPHYRHDYDGAPDAYRRGSKNQSAAPRSKRPNAESSDAAPGTGFGDERYAPSYEVRFAAERRAAGKTFIKYEWRETLCRMGVAHCGRQNNRFWPGKSVHQRHRDRDYAAYPPGYRVRDQFVRPGRYR